MLAIAVTECKSWCYTKKKRWESKCQWMDTCGGCDRCRVIRGLCVRANHSRLRASMRFSDISLLRVVHVPKPEMNIMAQENKQIHERYREHLTGNAARLSLQAQRKETELPKINGSEAKWLQGTIVNSNGRNYQTSMSMSLQMHLLIVTGMGMFLCSFLH